MFKKVFSCKAFLSGVPKRSFVYQMSERPKQSEAPKKGPLFSNADKKIDDADSSSNKDSADDFKKRYGDKKEVTYDQNGVKYKYVFEAGDTTVKVTKINQSERDEKGPKATPGFSRTVTYLRLDADKVIGMPGLQNVLDQGKSDDSSSPSKGPKFQLELGAMLPKSDTSVNQQGSVLDYGRVGGGMTARLMFADPNKPGGYLALTGLGQLQLESSTLVSAPHDSVDVRDSWTGRMGLGVEAGYSFNRFLAVYGGLAATGEYSKSFTTTVKAENGGTVQTGTDSGFDVGLAGTAGLRVTPIDGWYIYGAVQPTIKSKGSTDVPLIGGLGHTF